jgi:hypothetical protein
MEENRKNIEIRTRTCKENQHLQIKCSHSLHFTYQLSL